MKIIFIVCNPSQLDHPFYVALHKGMPDGFEVIIWNDFGLNRSKRDPEMGVIPQFPVISGEFYRWVDVRCTSLLQLARNICESRPDLVVIQDQPWRVRVSLASLIRFSGIRIALRTDKSAYSESARAGLARWFESMVARITFPLLVPVSRLTSEYYNWPTTLQCPEFPYCTDEMRHTLITQPKRASARRLLGISDDAKVVLSIKKMHSREDPNFVLKAFCAASTSRSDLCMIIVGDGPLLPELRSKYSHEEKVKFTGYVPYRDLVKYFEAADLFVHTPHSGPWEVSVTDALVCGLPVVATNNVGAAVACMSGTPAERFLLSNRDVTSLSRVILEAIKNTWPSEVNDFARNSYTVGKVVNRWLVWAKVS